MILATRYIERYRDGMNRSLETVCSFNSCFLRVYAYLVPMPELFLFFLVKVFSPCMYILYTYFVERCVVESRTKEVMTNFWNAASI